ncbi:MAG TPA: hypothetical protein VN372_08150 [Methanospirillum sp.]|nr:hypothetical protein [Methanospirillum sp.]
MSGCSASSDSSWILSLVILFLLLTPVIGPICSATPEDDAALIALLKQIRPLQLWDVPDEKILEIINGPDFDAETRNKLHELRQNWQGLEYLRTHPPPDYTFNTFNYQPITFTEYLLKKSEEWNTYVPSPEAVNLYELATDLADVVRNNLVFAPELDTARDAFFELVELNKGDVQTAWNQFQDSHNQYGETLIKGAENLPDGQYDRILENTLKGQYKLYLRAQEIERIQADPDYYRAVILTAYDDPLNALTSNFPIPQDQSDGISLTTPDDIQPDTIIGSPDQDLTDSGLPGDQGSDLLNVLDILMNDIEQDLIDSKQFWEEIPTDTTGGTQDSDLDQESQPTDGSVPASSSDYYITSDNNLYDPVTDTWFSQDGFPFNTPSDAVLTDSEYQKRWNEIQKMIEDGMIIPLLYTNPTDTDNQETIPHVQEEKDTDWFSSHITPKNTPLGAEYSSGAGDLFYLVSSKSDTLPDILYIPPDELERYFTEYGVAFKFDKDSYDQNLKGINTVDALKNWAIGTPLTFDKMVVDLNYRSNWWVTDSKENVCLDSGCAQHDEYGYYAQKDSKGVTAGYYQDQFWRIRNAFEQAIYDHVANSEGLGYPEYWEERCNWIAADLDDRIKAGLPSSQIIDLIDTLVERFYTDPAIRERLKKINRLDPEFTMWKEYWGKTRAGLLELMEQYPPYKPVMRSSYVVKPAPTVDDIQGTSLYTLPLGEVLPGTIFANTTPTPEPTPDPRYEYQNPVDQPPAPVVDTGHHHP